MASTDLLLGTVFAVMRELMMLRKRRYEQLRYITEESFALHWNCDIMIGCVAIVCVFYVFRVNP